MSVSTKLGDQLMNEFGKGAKVKVRVILLDKERTTLVGPLFTAQHDYLQLDDEGMNKRVTVPLSAIAVVAPA